jgi:hypothetical protein
MKYFGYFRQNRIKLTILIKTKGQKRRRKQGRGDFSYLRGRVKLITRKR